MVSMAFSFSHGGGCSCCSVGIISATIICPTPRATSPAITANFIFMKIYWCEQGPSRSRVTLREEGQVELLGETPNGLRASPSLPAANRQCQYFLANHLRVSNEARPLFNIKPTATRVSPAPVPQTQSAFHQRFSIC